MFIIAIILITVAGAYNFYKLGKENKENKKWYYKQAVIALLFGISIIIWYLLN